MRFLSQLNKDYLQGKTCLLRINLDIKDPKQDSIRLEASLPSIKLLSGAGSKVIILSHRGRPQKVELELSLKPLVEILSQKIGTKLDWLENLRFDPREQKNSDEFGKELASKGDFFVNDDFAVSHRNNASVVAIAKHLPSFAGLRLEEEIKTLTAVRDNSQKPLVVILGGIKIEDKIGVIENLQNQADYFLMGSAYVDLEHPALQSPKIIIPEDWLSGEGKKLDIGPKTIKRFSQIISSSKTIIWNGPLGQFENYQYLTGSKKIAEAIIKSGAFSVIGGGDTDQMLNQLGINNKFNFVSTGGGAMLEFLAGKKLPALEALENNKL